MSSDHPDRQTTPDYEAPQTLSIPRWVGIVVALIVLVPILLMSLMMVMMILVGPPMQGGMAVSGPGHFAVVGVVPLVLVLGVFYGLYRLYVADPE